MKQRRAFMAFLLVVSTVWPGRAADMIEIEAKFVKASPTIIENAVFELWGTKLDQAVIPINQSHGPIQVRPLFLMGAFLPDDQKPFPRELSEKVISTSKIVTLVGHKATLESQRELRYPSKFSKPTSETEPPTPIAFDTKKIGISLEIEPTIGPADTIDLVVTQEISTFHGFVGSWESHTEKRRSLPTDQEVTAEFPGAENAWQPIIHFRESLSNLTVLSGGPCLFGEYKFRDENGKEFEPAAERYYVILTARILPRK